jgi:predicted component of type VI protein secretion system
MVYRLIMLSGPMQGQRLSVERQPMTVGRGADCALVIPDEEMALQHAVLEHRVDGLYVRDLGAMGRILVNGREVHEQRLRHGDEVEMGRTRFLVQALVRADVSRARRRASWREAGRLAGAFVVLALTAWYGVA